MPRGSPDSPASTPSSSPFCYWSSLCPFRSGYGIDRGDTRSCGAAHRLRLSLEGPLVYVLCCMAQLHSSNFDKTRVRGEIRRPDSNSYNPEAQPLLLEYQSRSAALFGLEGTMVSQAPVLYRRLPEPDTFLKETNVERICDICHRRCLAA